MAKIFISTPRLRRENDLELLNLIRKSLIEKGHDIISDDFENSIISNREKYDNSISEILFNADIILSLITETSIESRSGLSELSKLRNYSAHTENKLFIPIISSRVNINDLPESFYALNAIKLENDSKIEIERITARIDEYINLFLGKRLAVEEKTKELKESIESSAHTYITDTIQELENREKYQRTISIVWYILGFLSIILGVIVAVWITTKGIIINNEKENWSITIFYGIKSIFIIILLITASKYCFNLAKSYMSESLKIADRIHAISFGKFYLQIFKNNLNSNEIKEIFRDWNINNQENNFSKQNSDDYDPKLFEKALELVNKIKGNE